MNADERGRDEVDGTTVIDLADILPASAGFAAADADAFFAAVPAKGCVALLLDADGRPLQLVCAKNLRAFLRRRLEAPDPAEVAHASKRVDYRELVRRVAWRRVDGEFEMDLVYIDAARAAFPTHWRQLIPERSAHFVRIDAAERFPDFARDESVDGAGHNWGPFPDRAKADRWIDAVRDAFDLCRYRNVLAQSPRGRACAYKQMNKCPAPCDGTITLDDYRARVGDAVESVRSPAATAERLTLEMKRQAANLEFEQAARTKSRLATLEQLRVGPYAAVRLIESFRFISVQPGPRRGTARVFVATAEGIAEVAAVIDEGVDVGDLRRAAAMDVPPSAWPRDVLLGTICHHLVGPKSSQRFVAASELDAARLATLVQLAMKPRPATQEDQAVRETRLQV